MNTYVEGIGGKKISNSFIVRLGVSYLVVFL